MKIDQYRVESGSVFEFSADHGCYLFIGKLNGQTIKQFIEDYEQNWSDSHE